MINISQNKVVSHSIYFVIMLVNATHKLAQGIVSLLADKPPDL